MLFRRPGSRTLPAAALIAAAGALAAGCASSVATPPARNAPAGVAAATAGAAGGRASTGARTPPSAAATAPPAAPLRPAARGARAYASTASAGERALVPGDGLRAGIVEDARALAKRTGSRPPESDPRLDLAMTDLARALRGEDLPALEVVDFLLSHYGIAEPSPHLLMSRSTTGADRQIREHTAGEIAEIMRTTPAARIGVGIDRDAEFTYVVVGLQEKHLELQAVPRQLSRGGTAVVSGKLEAGYREPQVVITAPDGKVSEQRGFAGQLRCASDGRYQVEVTAVDARGTAVLANFPVFCGVPPPAVAPRAAGVQPGGTDPAEAESQMLALVNRDRAAARLPPVKLDPRLGDVARAHSREMAGDDAVFHVSPKTGSALDRIRGAGLTPTLVLENVGRAYSPDEAESGFMASPGHRGNIVDPRAARVGIGIVFGKPVTGTVPMFVTQLFTN